MSLRLSLSVRARAKIGRIFVHALYFAREGRGILTAPIHSGFRRSTFFPRGTFNHGVPGSIPGGPTNKIRGFVKADRQD